MRRRTTDVKSDEDSIDRLETRRARRVMTRESPPSTRVPRGADGRSRSVARGGGRLPTGHDSNRALHAATTRTRKSKPPVSPSDDGPYIQKNHMGVCIVHYGTHDRTRATCDIYRTRGPPARGGATGTIGASDLVHRSIPRPTTTDASWSRLESDRSERDATRERGRAVSLLERAPDVVAPLVAHRRAAVRADEEGRRDAAVGRADDAESKPPVNPRDRAGVSVRQVEVALTRLSLPSQLGQRKTNQIKSNQIKSNQIKDTLSVL